MKATVDMEIRRMQEMDLDAVHAIDQLSFSAPWSRRSYENELNDRRLSRSWVAVLDGSIIGAIVAWLLVDELHIVTLSVHPQHRRRGVARSLLRTALAEARQRGAVSAALEVRAGNRPAQELYRDFGFKIVGRRPNYYQDNGEDALLMTLGKIREMEV